ncbi:acyl-CoA thioester hydrolase [Arenicella xantha]|uniref:Acyl-CoA thioester hydrolase n=2 Tax=Arenicella xantha TaxID=644221 RepID=A0A395JIE7_9GAMM|nr:acyl-CoA thioester hydrolase [Arenicella xantha]
MSSVPQPNWVYPDPFILNIRVDASAIDSYQHVNNSVYLKWVDDCARAHSLAVGIDCEQATEFGLGMAVRESRALYLNAAFEGDSLMVGAWVLRNDKKLRITRQFQIVRVADAKVLVQAEVDYVCIDIKSGKPARMPREFRELYQPIVQVEANTSIDS